MQIQTMTSQRASMIDGQLRPNKVTNIAVLDAVAATPREGFVPQNMQGVAYVDEDVSLGHGRVLMEPMVFARLLEAANPQASDTALVLASGSGYAVCVLSQICAAATGLETIEPLIAQARAQAESLALPMASFFHSPSLQDTSALSGPYSLMLLAGAVSDAAKVAESLNDLAADGTRLVLVERSNPRTPGVALRLTRHGKSWQREALFDASVPLLPELTTKPSFQF